MLKIGSDFTPQVSNFIVAEVVSFSPEKSLYIFKVLRMWFYIINVSLRYTYIFFINYNLTFLCTEGLSEVQVPIGKFNCMDESEESVMNDTIKLNYAQIMKPRLISASNTKYSFPLTSWLLS